MGRRLGCQKTCQYLLETVYIVEKISPPTMPRYRIAILCQKKSHGNKWWKRQGLGTLNICLLDSQRELFSFVFFFLFCWMPHGLREWLQQSQPILETLEEFVLGITKGSHLLCIPQTQLNQLLFSDNRGICKSSCYTLIDSYSSSLLPSLTTSINWVPVICQTLSRVLGEQRWAKLYGPCYCKLLVQWQCPSTDTIHGSTSVFYSRWKVLWG